MNGTIHVLFSIDFAVVFRISQKVCKRFLMESLGDVAFSFRSSNLLKPRRLAFTASEQGSEKFLAPALELRVSSSMV